jgi:hypothetical protein
MSTLLMQSAGVRFKPRTRIAFVPWRVRVAAAAVVALLSLLLWLWL